VRFTGSLREDGGNAESFEEVWNLAKPIDGGSGWLLAGIQQVH
jgi:predicted lipid-binding transport protein (Tim44 family)